VIKITRGAYPKNSRKPDHDLSTVITKGIGFLERKASSLFGFQTLVANRPDMSDAVEMPKTEIFTSAIIYDLIRFLPVNKQILTSTVELLKSCATPKTGTFNFFQEQGIIPDDVDCTGVALWALLVSGAIPENAVKTSVELCVKNTNKAKGIIETYLPPFNDRTGRFCSVALCNIMRVVYATHLESQAVDTENYLYEVLEKKLYLGDDAVLYYPQHWHFFYFLAQCISTCDKAKQRFMPLLCKRIVEGLENEKISEIERAMRVILGHQLGLYNQFNHVKIKIDKDVEVLMAAQSHKGCWDLCTFHTNGKGVKFYFGSEAMTTAFVLKALHSHQCSS